MANVVLIKKYRGMIARDFTFSQNLQPKYLQFDLNGNEECLENVVLQ